MAIHEHTQKEEWRPIPGYEGYYEASSHGRIRSVDRVVSRGNQSVRLKGKILSPAPLSSGHLSLGLYKNSKGARKAVHRLVMQAFIGECPEGMEVLHADDNPANNHLWNLRYGTRSENLYDAVHNKKHHQSRKTHCSRGHLLEEPNLNPWQLRVRGHRVCQACTEAHYYRIFHKLPMETMQSLSDAKYKQIMG